MRDVLADGRAIRVFTLVVVNTRECVALEAAPAFRGTEFTSTALDHWAYRNKVPLDVTRPGKPVDNGVCEAFNGSLRRECLSLQWLASLDEAKRVLSSWQDDDNNTRPHKS